MIDRACLWCGKALPQGSRSDAQFCPRKCRQTAFRLRRRAAWVGRHDRPMRFCYSDPPYPGLAKRYYGREPTYAGEVDHRALIESMREFDGWALSTGAYALREVLPICPPGARVCPWVKPLEPSPATHGIHNAWEPVIVVGGRQRPPGVRDWLEARPARFGGELVGRKPLAFAAWLFDLLGMAPGDELEDRFPGTGIIGRAWAYLSSTPAERLAVRVSSGERLSVPRSSGQLSAGAGERFGGRRLQIEPFAVDEERLFDGSCSPSRANSSQSEGASSERGPKPSTDQAAVASLRTDPF